MRHGKKFNHLSRTSSHRKAMLSNMASSLILKKRIKTTLAKAKELRKYVEPLITKAKEDTTHSRRVVFSYLQNKYSVQTLFGEIATRIGDRPGGYTRILKTGNRLGDNAEMCFIELVDFNESMLKEAKPQKAKTRRGRSKKKSETPENAEAKPSKSENIEEKAENEPASDEVIVEEVPELEDNTSEAPQSNAEDSQEKPEEDTNDETEEKK